MTNEERDKAIRILQWLHDNTYLFRSTKEDVKFATEYAIKALEESKIDNNLDMYVNKFDGMTNGEVLEKVFGFNFYPPLVFCADWYKEPYEGEQK